MLTAVGHLANHGYVTRLKTSQGEPRILLAPELLNNLAASFVLEARRNAKGLGSLEEKACWRAATRFRNWRASPSERDILLDSAALLFLEHNVCFRETDLLSRSLPRLPGTHQSEETAVDDEQPVEDGVAYTVSGAVENVYASLVVLMGYTQTFTRTNQWRNHARYEVGDGRCAASGWKRSARASWISCSTSARTSAAGADAVPEPVRELPGPPQSDRAAV